MTEHTPVTTLPFVGPKYGQLLAKLGIQTVGDLLYHLPHRYVDLSQITPIDQLQDDLLQVIQAELTSLKKIRLKGGKVMIQGQAEDATGRIQLTWFNQPYLENSLKVGHSYRIVGEPELAYSKRQILNPQTEPADKPPVHTGRLVPIYPQTAGVSSKWLRARLAPLMSKIETLAPDFLPDRTIQSHQLKPLAQALRQTHQPATMDEAHQARHRLAFEEMLLLQLLNQTSRQQWQLQNQAPTFAIDDQQFQSDLRQLPFTLTEDQLKVTLEVQQSLNQSAPMNRLIQGDVGSGKTIVAFLAALQVIRHGYQVAMLAPTSVLAQQHFQTFQSLLRKMDSSGTVPSLALRTAKSKMEPADITIGTHALLNQSIDLEKLGLLIIDEQHRFGVEQRAALQSRSKHGIHVMSMTATPIPRTLALTAFGDLDVSTIASKPANRLPIKTHIVPQSKRQDMYPYLSQAIDRGEQVYIICPLVEESEKITEVKSATTEFERLQSIFPQHRLALLHGRMKANEKDAILQQFKDHQFDMLVATPVVEVGIDVPNATILVIEGAERFGLAQLHQLRGRVGRGDRQSYCFLLSDAKEATQISRLQHMTHHDSGIQLAEIDLRERGPGEVYGVRQSGIPTLKAASYFDLDLIKKTQAEAQIIIQNNELDHNPALKARLNKLTTSTN